jgi:hypothetical protein
VVEIEWTHSLANEVSQDRLLELTRIISSEVRLSGSDEERRSMDYLEGLLREAGLETELLLHDAYISIPGPAEIVAGHDRYPCITHSFSASSGLSGIEGQLVDVGVPGNDKGGPARGNVALLDGLAMPGSVRTVEADGAIAQIYINGALTHEMIVSTVWGSPGMADRGRYPKSAVVSVTKEIGETLRERVRSRPVTVRVHTEVSTGWRKTPVLVGNIKAPGTDDFVLFSGHVDSWHLGAMDNGGANATMVEAARILAGHRSRLHRGLRVAFWSGHSHGRYSGSAWYADTHWHELRAHCVAHVNIDSIGGHGAYVLSEGIAMPSTRSLGVAAIAEVAHAKFDGTHVGRAGDQSFVALGIPSLWMSLSEQPPSDHPTARAFSGTVGSPKSGGLGWWWHTVEDTIDKLDPKLLLRDAQIYIVALGKLVAEPLVPLSAVAEADELIERLTELAHLANGRFELSTTIDAAKQCRSVADRLDRWRKAQAKDVSMSKVRLFNDGVNHLLRGLVVVLNSELGPYAQDPAAGVPPLPLLEPIRAYVAMRPESDESKSLAVDLVRARNRFEDLINRATQEAGAALDQLR